MMHLHPVYDTDPHFSINVETRAITYMSHDKLIIVQGDHNSERYTFEMPRYIDGHDMMLCNLVQVHYINIDSNDPKKMSTGVYQVDDMMVSPDDPGFIVCSWLVSQKATLYVGSLSFVLRFTCMSGYKIDYSWSTGVFSGVAIATGIDNAGLIVEQYDDTLQRWYMELIAAGTMGVNIVDEARSNAIENLTEETTALKNDIFQAASNARATIPEEYTALSDEMNTASSSVGYSFTPGYVSAAGKFVEDSSSGRTVSDFICCPGNVEVIFSGENNHNNICAVSFYDAERNFIRGVVNVGEPNTIHSVVSPAGSYYIRLSTKDGMSKVLQFGEAPIPKVTTQIHSEIESVKYNVLRSMIRVSEGSRHSYIDIPTWVVGSYHTGKHKDEKNSCYSKLFPTDVVSAIEFNDSLYKALYLYYDEDKSFVICNSWMFESMSGGISTKYPYVAFELCTLDGSVIDENDVEASIHTIIDPPSVGKEVYVSVDGSDDNVGSFDSPFASLSRAINSGARNICVKSGVYTERVLASNINSLNIYAYNGEEYDSSNPERRPRPVFTNGKFIDISSVSSSGNGRYSFALSDAPQAYLDVFINKTVEPEADTSRPSYSAGLWLNHGRKYDDIKLKPVLSESELSDNNTFFFDGTKVYIHSESAQITGFTVVGDNEAVLSFNSCNNLTINGLVVTYGESRNLKIINSNNVQVSNCEFGYTLHSDNVSCNYSDVVFNNCLSYKARNDGFNTHYYGISVFNDCRSVYNYDDGESSHEYCEVIVNGGEYAYNGKGGHSPVNGCIFKCNNSYVHHNNVGMYLIADEEYNLSDNTISINGSAIINNIDEDIRVKLYDVIVANTKYGTKEIISGTFSDITA